jgi:hypothetical protein
MKNSIIIISILSLFVVSCTERIDFDLSKGRNNELVVRGAFTDELTTQTITLKRSTDFYQEQASAPEIDAQVSVTDGEQTFLFYDADKNGVYETPMPVAGAPGKTYRMNITLKTGENYTAESTMEALGEMDSIRYEYKDQFDFETGTKKWLYIVYLYAQEPSETVNFYQWEYYLNNKLETDTLSETVFTDDKFANGNYISEMSIFYIKEEAMPGPTAELKVKMSSLPKNYYDYFVNTMLETGWSGGPFAGTPTNVPSNISGGAKGFFAATAVKFKTIIVTKGVNPDYWNR